MGCYSFHMRVTSEGKCMLTGLSDADPGLLTPAPPIPHPTHSPALPASACGRETRYPLGGAQDKGYPHISLENSLHLRSLIDTSDSIRYSFILQGNQGYEMPQMPD
jgi:hypothetical protein